MKLHYVTNENGDWDGLYIDGKLAMEGHSFDVYTVLERLVGHKVEELSGTTLGGKWGDKLDEDGNLPPTLKELREWFSDEV